ANANDRRSRRAIAQVRRPANRARRPAPIAIRISAAQTGPTSGEATRSNRNAAPHTAPRKRSWARRPRWTAADGSAEEVPPGAEGAGRAEDATGDSMVVVTTRPRSGR